MDPFEAYKLWLGLKLHFTKDEYNYFLMDGRVKCSSLTFQQKKDKFNFYKLVRKYNDLEGFYIANLVYGDPQWSGDLMTIEADKNYIRWLKNKNALRHIFKTDLEILSQFDQVDIVQVVFGQNPKLLTLVYQNDITIETLLIMNEIGPGFIDNWNNKIMDPIIWPKFYQKLIKYRPWILKLDLTKFKAISQEVMINAKEDSSIPMSPL